MSLPDIYKALYAAPKPGEKPYVADTPLPKPGKNQVLVKVEFSPINPYDIMNMHSGFGPPSGKPTLVGSEGSGTVVAVGEDLVIPFKIGDRVHIKGIGSMSQYQLSTTEEVFLIQGNLSFEEAASHYGNPATVLYMAVTAQRGNHKAVIHTAGTSALGKMLVRYFKLKGIKTINIVRRDDYTEELKKDGADYVVNSKDADFEAKLKEAANKEGATLAFDAIGGEFTAKVLSAQPPNSTCYLYGGLSGEYGVKNISILDLFQGKTLGGFTVADYFNEREKAGDLRKVYEECHSLLSTAFKTDIQKVFRLEELEEALAYYKENSSKGKILIKPN